MFFSRLLFIGILFLPGFLTAQLQFIDSFSLKWEQYKLNNGISILLQPDNKEKEVAVEFWVHTGARDEIKGKYGFAHFFEHATPFTSDTGLLKTIRAIRTNSNAQTRKDYTRYYVQVKAGAIELLLKYTADRIKADTSLISDSTIEYEKARVLNEMNRQEPKPLYGPSSTFAIDAATFGENHLYGHSNYGTIDENKSFTVKEVRQWYKKYFFPDNILVFVTGNFDPKKIKTIIEKEFGAINTRGIKGEPKQDISKNIPQNYSISIPSVSHFIALTWRIPGYGSKELASLEVLAMIMNERLNKEKPVAVLQTGSKDLFNIYELAGQFGIYATFSDPADSASMEKFLYDRMKKIQQNAVTIEELENAKREIDDLTKEKLAKLGFSESRTELLGEGLLFMNKPGYYLEQIKRQSALKVKDVQTAALKWFNTRGARVLIIAKK